MNKRISYQLLGHYGSNCVHLSKNEISFANGLNLCSTIYIRKPRSVLGLKLLGKNIFLVKKQEPDQCIKYQARIMFMGIRWGFKRKPDTLPAQEIQLLSLPTVFLSSKYCVCIKQSTKVKPTLCIIDWSGFCSLLQSNGLVEYLKVLKTTIRMF